jgi:hypothetical protein
VASPLASSDEGLSGLQRWNQHQPRRETFSVVLAQGGSWEIAYCNFTFGQLSSVVVGECQGPGRQGELSSCGKHNAASCADSGAHLLLSALRHQATTILFYCCILFLFFSSLAMRG